ncbi:MAG: helix-turn-helix transcriptional regulator [Hungatella hathewayi]|nr:helix-turn-helix transcriptional regulator [Hungatella hathewayi]
MIKFDRLFNLLKKKNISQTYLCDELGISRSTLNKLRHNEIVYSSTIDRLLILLDCDDINDICEFVKEES